MTSLLISGVLFGLNAGITPGPLLTLVIAESLRGGWPAGFRVCLAPLVTDSAAISLALLIIAPLPAWGVSLLSVAGGLIIAWMGWEAARSAAPTPAEVATTGWSAFWKGVTTNLLNPHVYLFWVTAGGPVLKEAIAHFGPAGPLGFMAAFFASIIGAKMAVAYGVSRGRHFLVRGTYRWALGVSGGALALFGLYRVYEGIRGLM